MIQAIVQRGGASTAVMHAYVATMRQNLAHSQGLTAGRIARANIATRNLAWYVIIRATGCGFKG